MLTPNFCTTVSGPVTVFRPHLESLSERKPFMFVRRRVQKVRNGVVLMRKEVETIQMITEEKMLYVRTVDYYIAVKKKDHG